jgi:hypothetical protein
MASKSYPLEPGGPARVVIEWNASWSDVRVRVDGVEVGRFANANEVRAGRAFSLPGGGTLVVRRVPGLFAAQLEVTKAGAPLPGSSGDPSERVRQAAQLLYFLAAVNVVLGAFAAVASIDFLRSLGLGWASVGEGAIFGLLGWLTSRRSLAALLVGIVLFGLDTLLAVLAALQSTQGAAIGGIVARVFLFAPLVNGARAMLDRRSLDRA